MVHSHVFVKPLIFSLNSCNPAGVNKQQSLILDSLSDFFAYKNNFDILCKLAGKTSEKSVVTVDGDKVEKHKLSLRLIEFICATHSKTNPIVYNLDGHEIPFNVHLSYQKNLDQWSKKNFDPFARRDKIVVVRNGQKIKTTSAQMQFMKWAIQHNVIKYCEQHIKKFRNIALSSKTKVSERKFKKEAKRKREVVVAPPTVYYGSKKFKVSF